MSQTEPTRVEAVPYGMRTVTPHLVCAGAADAMDFYKRAFAAEECARLEGPDGKLMHGCLRIGDSNVMLVDEMPDYGIVGPLALKGSPVTIHLQVEDCEMWFKRALDAGAKEKMPLTDMFWGDRYGLVSDPFGHDWSIATHIRDLTPEEIKAAAAECSGGCGPQ